MKTVCGRPGQSVKLTFEPGPKSEISLTQLQEYFFLVQRQIAMTKEKHLLFCVDQITGISMICETAFFSRLETTFNAQ